MPPIADLQVLLSSIEPTLNPGTYVFVTLPEGQHLDPGTIIASVREPEGLSVVVEDSIAAQEGLVGVYRWAWIMLAVNSDLQAVGLTAAFASALAKAGISCNVVAGAHHDHIFVPIHLAQQAMSELVTLQRQTQEPI